MIGKFDKNSVYKKAVPEIQLLKITSKITTTGFDATEVFKNLSEL